MPLVQPKLWNSTSKKLTVLEAMSIPQTDPSLALLLVDGTVFCWRRETLLSNRLHEQSFQCRDLRSRVPFQQQRPCSLETRPKIQSVSPATSVAVGGKIIINTDSNGASFSSVRFCIHYAWRKYRLETHPADAEQYTGESKFLYSASALEPGCSCSGVWDAFCAE